MILTCPACGTQYVVKDGAIPVGGRKVRCASCRHSWHQEPETLELSPAAAIDANDIAEEDAVPSGLDEPVAGSTSAAEDDAYSSGPSAEEPGPADYGHTSPPAEAPVPSETDYAPPVAAQPDDDDEFSPFARRDDVIERRSGGWMKWMFALVLVAALAAAFWFVAPPEWKARAGLAQVTETPLQLMMTHSDRQKLASGNELLAVSGRVINPTDRRQSVPTITAELKSRTGEVVHRWTIAPPAPSLAPGESAPFNSAEVDVPAGGEELTVSLGAPRA